jgi:hypothetical protein
MLAAFAWVTGATGVSLAGLGALPGWLGGEPRAVRTVPTVDEAERRLGARLALPAYFPSSLAWPPAEIRVAGGRGGGAELVVRPRGGGEPEVTLLQSVTPGAPIPGPLAAGVTVLAESRTVIGTRPAIRARVVAQGLTWEELRWQEGGRALVLRSRGSVDELFRMAHSVRREGRP